MLLVQGIQAADCIKYFFACIQYGKMER